MNAELVLPIFLGPIVAAVISLVFSNFGVYGKTRRVAYYLKRIELIEKLLQSQEVYANRDVLKEEINDIAVQMSLTSISNELLAQLEFHKRPWRKKIVHVPKQDTLAGKIAVFIFYFYGLIGLIYLLYVPPMLYLGYSDTLNIFLASLVAFFIAYLCRFWVIKAAHRSAIVQRAKRELFLNDKLLGRP